MARRPEGSTIPLVKPRQLLAVEHPCHVRDAERAVGMLGGVRAIAKASRDGTAFLECHMRPQDSLSHPLFGELVRTPAVLLKVRRKRDGGAGAALSTEVVGVVNLESREASLEKEQAKQKIAYTCTCTREDGGDFELVGSCVGGEMRLSRLSHTA